MNPSTIQLEISLSTRANRRRLLPSRFRRVSRARWWFNQMHRVVDEAMDWTPAPVTPEQAGLPWSR